MAQKLSVKTKVIDTSLHQMTCGFRGYTNHKGIDLIPKSTAETPNVLAFEKGKVIAVGNVKGTNSDTNTRGCGTYVAIEHENGIVTRYQHLKYNSVKVKIGETVKKGQAIAVYGRPTTGNSTGSHLHFDISLVKKPAESYVSGTFCGKTRYYINPQPYLEGTKTFTKANYPKKTVTASVLNVRKNPNGTIVSKLCKGDKVTCYEEKNGWTRIDTAKWVSSDYLI